MSRRAYRRGMAPTARRKLYPVAAGTPWEVGVERRSNAIVALWQGDQVVTLRQQDLFQIASALADWAPATRNGL